MRQGEQKKLSKTMLSLCHEGSVTVCITVETRPESRGTQPKTMQEPGENYAGEPARRTGRTRECAHACNCMGLCARVVRMRMGEHVHVHVRMVRVRERECV